MNFWVHVGSRAKKGLRGIPAADLRHIMAALESMRTEPLAGDVTKLKGADGFRRRFGSYRILFMIDFERRQVSVTGILRRTSATY